MPQVATAVPLPATATGRISLSLPHLFSGKVELTDAVQMGEEELAETAQQYARLGVEEESVDMDDQMDDLGVFQISVLQN